MNPFSPVPDSMKKDALTVTNFLNKLKVSQDSIHAMFSAPNEVYKRAFRRLRDGHIDVESLSFVKARVHTSGQEICVLSAQVAASLRSVGACMCHMLYVCYMYVCVI